VRYFAFLRGINVTGRNMIRMADLKELCTSSLGFADVQTLLQSGNVVFSAKRKPSEAAIAEAIRASFGLSIKVMVRNEPELRAVVENNPFTPIRNPGHLLVVFLDREAAPGAVWPGPEKIHVAGREVYVDYVNGVGQSKLNLERLLGRAGTGRNWNTVTKLLALSTTPSS